MPTFTLPKTNFPPVGTTFFVGVPLNGSVNGSASPIKASDLAAKTKASLLFYVDPTTNFIKFVIPSLDYPTGHAPFTKDFVVQGGEGLIIKNGNSPTTGQDLVFTGIGWCNTFSSTPAPGHVTSC